MVIQLICKYCDFKWEKHIYSESSIAAMTCIKCGDKHLRAKERTTIDTYHGAPAFPAKDVIPNYGDYEGID